MKVNCNVGIIGAGRMGTRHARVLREMPHVEIVGVAEPNAETREAACSELDVEGVESIEALLALEPDAVYVTTPIAFHLDHVKTALTAGAHVFCEKPLTATVAEGKKILNLAERSGKIVFTGLAWRFDPVAMAVRTSLKNGDIGTVTQFQVKCGGPSSGKRPAWFEDPAVAVRGGLLDNGVHFFDMINWSLGHVVKVSSFNDQTDTKIDLNAAVVAETKCGQFGVAQFTSNSQMGAAVEYYGTDGVIMWEPGKPRYTCQHGKEISTVDVGGEERFRALSQAFVKAVMGEAPPAVTVEEAVLATAVAEACYLAGETGRTTEVEQVGRNHT